MKKIQVIYSVWLAVLVVLLVLCSLGYLQVSSLGSVQTTCFMLFGMTDLLCVLMLHQRSWFALRRLVLFFGATALYAVYCFCMNGLPHTGSTTDSLVAGGLLCTAAVLSGEKYHESCG